MPFLDFLKEYLSKNRPGAIVLGAGFAIVCAVAAAAKFGVQMPLAIEYGTYVVVSGLLLLVAAQLASDKTLMTILRWMIAGIAIIYVVLLFLSIAANGTNLMPPPRCILQFWSDCSLGTQGEYANTLYQIVGGLPRVLVLVSFTAIFPLLAVSVSGQIIRSAIRSAEAPRNMVLGTGALSCTFVLSVLAQPTAVAFLGPITSFLALQAGLSLFVIDMIAASLLAIVFSFLGFMIAFSRGDRKRAREHDAVIAHVAGEKKP
jgi:hypothetical protein